jgi:hypothetical protein
MNDNTPGNANEDEAILAAENEGMDEAVGHETASRINPLAEIDAGLEKDRDQLKDNVLRALAETDIVR